MKEGDPNAKSGRRGGGVDEKGLDLADNDSAGGPETNTTEAANPTHSKPSQGGTKRVGGVRPKSSIALKKIEDDAMLRVRRDIRQPVTSLWQTATERASTAPTRAAGGADTNARRDLSRRRPLSEIGAARAQRGAEITDSHRGAAASGAGGENRNNGRGQPSREGKPTDARDVSAPTRGQGGREVDRNHKGRRTPIPLRSSHRIGPVGGLGAAKRGGSVLTCCAREDSKYVSLRVREYDRREQELP